MAGAGLAAGALGLAAAGFSVELPPSPEVLPGDDVLSPDESADVVDSLDPDPSPVAPDALRESLR